MNAHEISQISFARISQPSEVASLALGKLERRVLNEAWRRGELAVREMFLGFDERVAYTTLMTTLDRLYKKKLLERRKDGGPFYTPPPFPTKSLSRESEKTLSTIFGPRRRRRRTGAGLYCRYSKRARPRLLDELDRW